MIIIADSSCLISLYNINHLDLLEQIFKTITITNEVKAEFKLPIPDWINVLNATNKKVIEELKLYLDTGEATSIALAAENPGSLLIIDELEGRKAARKYAVNYTGTIGILGRAKQMKIIPAVAPVIADLKKVGFRLSEDLEHDFLKSYGESE